MARTMECDHVGERKRNGNAYGVNRNSGIVTGSGNASGSKGGVVSPEGATGWPIERAAANKLAIEYSLLLKNRHRPGQPGQWRDFSAAGQY